MLAVAGGILLAYFTLRYWSIVWRAGVILSGAAVLFFTVLAGMVYL